MSADIAITTPGILFSTVSLIMLAYTNRFLAISTLIRTLSENYHAKADIHTLKQIKLLKKRTILIKAIQMLCILALLLSIVSMLLILYSSHRATRIVFSISLVLLVASLVCAVVETALSTNALNLSIPETRELGEPHTAAGSGIKQKELDLDMTEDMDRFSGNLLLNNLSNRVI